MIYLDAAATTKPDPRVIDAMMPYFTGRWHNPSSLYDIANKVKKDIEKARSVVGNFIGADGSEIFFTSGGSESNCWAIKGFVNNCIAKGETPNVITSVIEHKSILSCVEDLSKFSVQYIKVNDEGFIDVESLENTLRVVAYAGLVPIVSIQFANNEIGTIQHIKEISSIAHKYGAVFHTDAVQAFGYLDINVKELGIDMLSASGHKIGAPKGIGFLYKKNGIDIKPLIYGSQMNGLRGGTENVPYIIGMAKAVELIQRDKEYDLRLTVLRNNFIAQLKAFGCKINGSLNERLPNNINVTFPQNITGESLLYTLDLDDIMISTGSACNSHSVEPSYVLKAIGLTNEEAMKTIRISLPHDITYDDIEHVIREIDKTIKLIELE